MTPALIGRDHPAGVLRAEIGRATDSHGGLVLVTGEAGIGKTSLVTDAAHEARRRGALVVGGSCWDSDSAPGYWPWVQVLRALRRSATATEWASALEASEGRIGLLLGDAAKTRHDDAHTDAHRTGGEADGAQDAAPGAHDGTEAFGLYDAVTTALVTVSQSRPVMVLLDDLHSSDPASLRLLEFAAQHAWFERLLLVGTYRDVEVETAGHPLRQLILPLVSRASTTLTLTGLDRDDVGALMTVTAGREPAAHLVDEVHRRTGGNPFFVEQTARLWHSGSPVSTIPPGVREAVRQRLTLLPGPVGDLLTTAAVLGQEFRRQVLAVVHGAPVPHVERLLERAAAARVVVRRSTGGYAFAHDLLRETLYDALGEAGLRERHADVVRALDAHTAIGEPVFPGELARHAHLAGEALERGRRVELLLDAARDASGRLAEEESVGHYRRALDTVSGPSEDGQPPDPRRAALICLDLASQLRHGGEETEGWRYFDRAVALAEELDDSHLLARVAMTLHRQGEPGGREAATATLLSEAHRRLTGKDGQESLSPDRLAQELAIHITALARRGSDDEALAFSLWARHDSIWGLGSSAERLALTDEMADVARRTHHRDMELHATSMRWVALLEQGDPGYADQFQAFVTLAERVEMRRFELGIAVDTSLIASLQGRFAEAEQALADEAITGHGQEHAAFGFMAGHMNWALRLLQGRYDEAAAAIAELPGTGYPYPRLLEAVTAVERGDVAPALRHVVERSDRHAPYPRAITPLWLRLVAQTAAATGDARLIARAEDELAPYTGQWVVSLYGCDISGPVDLWLGVLAAARHDQDTAVTALGEAIVSADRLGARPWSVRGRLHLAGSLLARDAAGDAAEADRLLVEVFREAAELGLEHFAERAAALSGRGGSLTRHAAADDAAPGSEAGSWGSPGAPVGAFPVGAFPVGAAGIGSRAGDRDAGGGTDTHTGPGRPVVAPTPEFRRAGPVWTLRWDGVTTHMPDAKGLRDLHALLSTPGSDLPAVRLLAPEGGDLVVAARQFGGDDVLDDEAKRRYKERLAGLDEEIDRAAAREDRQRVQEYERERQALLDELRTAAGLGGRTRRLGDEAERARKTVTARIRDTLRKLDGLHPGLAAHLRESVTTGSTCAYRPATTPDWRL